MLPSRTFLRGAMMRRAVFTVCGSQAASTVTAVRGSVLCDGSARPATVLLSSQPCMVAGAALSVQMRFASTKNPYTVLGIKQGATKEEIKKAYRVMARKHHPDAPGGNHEKFQEIQEAYEQVKSGVWIKKGEDAGGAGGGGGDGSSGNRFSGFRYKTRTHHNSKVSYDEFYTEMHTGKVKRDPFGDDEADGTAEAAAAKDPRKNPFAMNELAFQAWLRFIIMWCVLFSSLRFTLFLLFPPNWEKPKRKPPPKELRKKLPPPKPLATTSDSIVA